MGYWRRGAGHILYDSRDSAAPEPLDGALGPRILLGGPRPVPSLHRTQLCLSLARTLSEAQRVYGVKRRNPFGAGAPFQATSRVAGTL